MDRFERIYTRRAADYHRMITAEDVDGNILATLEALTPLTGRRIIDVGCGTGRLPLLFEGRAEKVVALDLHQAMLVQNISERRRVSGTWEVVRGDVRRLPFQNAWAELTTAGWALGHFRSWFPDDWSPQIGRALQEMLRVTRPGGKVVILETLGTGSLEPAPPAPELAEYYEWLEWEWGFTLQVIQTDYHFASVEQAVEQTEFFFGPELSAQIRQRRWTRLPEWTGVWSRAA